MDQTCLAMYDLHICKLLVAWISFQQSHVDICSDIAVSSGTIDINTTEN